MADSRPLSARSVVLSALLGTSPPRMPVRRILRITALFGLADGAVRTALTRMVQRGEVVADGDGWYALSDALIGRQQRQTVSRDPRLEDWNGRWTIAVLTAAARSPSERTASRAAFAQLRLAEQRDGVWVRPDNLDPARLPDARAQVDPVCVWWTGHPDRDDAELAAALWDLDGWSAGAERLRRGMAELSARIGSGDTTALAPGFVLSAEVLRHLLADPLLPVEVLPRRWPGTRLRADYDRFDRAYRDLLLDWVRRS